MTVKKRKTEHKNGSALVITVVMLSVASLVIGSVITLTMNYSRNLRQTMQYDRAFYLADSGIRCALARLNTTGLDTINLNEMDTFLSGELSTGCGFSTKLEPVAGKTNRLIAVGYYGGFQQQVEVGCYDASRPRDTRTSFNCAIYEGNSTHTLGLLGNDFVNGPVHVQGNLDANGAALDRSETDLGDVDGSDENNSHISEGESWIDAGAPRIFEGPATEAEFEAQQAFAETNEDILHTDGAYNPGEAFLDQGNGTQDIDELVLTSRVEKNAYRDAHPDAEIIRVGRGGNRYWFVDEGDGIYTPGEPFVDDRNGIFDRGVTAQGTIRGVAGSPAAGEQPDDGNDDSIDKPALADMYYHLEKSGSAPGGALPGWGHDIAITRQTYGGSMVGDGIAQKITDNSNPAHIFVRNPPRDISGENRTLNGIPRRTYDAQVYPDDHDRAGERIVDDYFLEDPSHETYGSKSYDAALTTTDTKKTAPEFLDIQENGNNKVYYVDGNLWFHSATAYAMRFSKPGTKVTIVVRGNITISDEFYYNGDYGNCSAEGESVSGSQNIAYEDMNSTIIENPLDNLCLIAMKNPDVDRILGGGQSGNIYIGDPMKGTGGSIHAKLYAENNFVDKNLNTSDQAFISIYGSMAAGNMIDIQRGGDHPTRLDVTYDERSSIGTPPEVQSGRSDGNGGQILDWRTIPGTWKSASLADHLVIPAYNGNTGLPEDDDGNNGHGNDPDGNDESNPGNGN